MPESASNPSNPFTPIFGKVPPYLAGRTQIIQDMAQAFHEGGNDPNLSSIFVGARGTGKTALLTYLANEAQGDGWIAVDVTAAPGMLEDILQRATEASAHLVAPKAARKLTGVEVAPLGALSWENASGHPLNWRSQMNQLFEALEATGTGILLTVDEVDPSLDEMVQLVTTYQHFVREDKRVALLMAGLPHSISRLLSGKSTSFLRRAFRHDLGTLPPYEVAEAFRITVESGGRTIDEDALDAAVAAIEGFPFMFQLVGYRAWNGSKGSGPIALQDVMRGAELARAELCDRIFDATYAELSKGDVAFLRAMLPDRETSLRKDLAERLGKGPSHVSTYKKRLLEAGVIDEPRPGCFRFALPGFRQYLESL